MLCDECPKLIIQFRFIQTYHRWAKPGVTNIPGEDMAYSNALGFAKREREMKQATPMQQPEA
eukprot:1151406-Pelagomonas_calceolata.AAC.6